MFQPDLFTKDVVAEGPDFPAEVATLRVRENGVPAPRSVPKTGDTDLDLPSLLERLAAVSSRPRYAYMVLNLIAQAAGQSNSAGPYVRENGRVTPVRDWLSDALLPMAQRDFRRRAVVEQVRCDLESKNCCRLIAKPLTGSLLTRSGSGCSIRGAPMSVGRFPISFAPAWFIATIKAIGSIIRTGAPSERRSIRSLPPSSAPWGRPADRCIGTASFTKWAFSTDR